MNQISPAAFDSIASSAGDSPARCAKRSQGALHPRSCPIFAKMLAQSSNEDRAHAVSASGIACHCRQGPRRACLNAIFVNPVFAGDLHEGRERRSARTVNTRTFVTRTPPGSGPPGCKNSQGILASYTFLTDSDQAHVTKHQISASIGVHEYRHRYSSRSAYLEHRSLQTLSSPFLDGSS